MKIDTHRKVETPEGFALELRLAGVMPRAQATIIDTGLRFLIYAISLPLLFHLDLMGEAAAYLVLFVGEWFYYVIFEVWAGGASPGKYWVGLRVLHDDGTPVGLSASVTRNFLRLIDFLPAAYGVGILSALWSPSFRRVGDWAAGTVVVYSETKTRRFRKGKGGRLRTRAPSGSSATKQEWTPEPLPLVLDSEERAAILEFERRFRGWTSERSVELSDILEPVSRQRGKAGLNRVLSYSAWLREGS